MVVRILGAAILCSTLTSGAMAQGVLTTHRIPAAVAAEAVARAVAACARQGYSVSAAVLDGDGVAQATLRGDGAGIHTSETAFDKAYTAVTFLPIRKQTRTGELGGAPAPLLILMAKVPHMLPSEGGLLISMGDEAVGGIGVGGAPGGNFDEGCARVGLDYIAGGLK